MYSKRWQSVLAASLLQAMISGVADIEIIEGIHFEECECIHCGGIAAIHIIEDSEKGTLPQIEFCPFCGMSNTFPKETN